MSKFPRKLVSNTEPLASVAGMYTTVESLQSFTAATGGMAITAVTITDNTYTALDDTAVITSGGYIKLTGTGFASGAVAYINAIACTTTFTSSSELRVVAPANTAGTLSLTAFNTTGSGAIWAAGLVYSGFPTVTTSSYTNSSAVVSTQLVASGDGTLTYSLQGGDTLPSGVTLSSSGLLSGTVTGITASTIYTFTVLVTDAQLQTTQQLITLSVLLAEQYFNSTVLLLHGDGAATVLATSTTVEYLVVAGGGGGGAGPGGGGGAGGLLASTTTLLPGSTYTVTIGIGGASTPGSWPSNTFALGNSGNNSSIIGTSVSITAIGGGGGAGNTLGAGLTGGSGGGGGASSGAGGTPTAGQGNAGGIGQSTSGDAGGGGGAGAVGSNSGTSGQGGNGGAGLASSISGSSVTYAGGGGGGANNAGSLPQTAGSGGVGGGGAGAMGASTATAGTVNRGGGGGGGGRVSGTTNYSGAAGGSGIIIVAYPSTYNLLTIGAGLTYTLNTTSRAGYNVYTFTAGTGTITFNPNNNNTFLDSSPNNLAITRTGTPTQGSFSPFSQTGWSGYFNGTSDWLTVGNSSLTVGTQSFTLEAWVYMPASSSGTLFCGSTTNTFQIDLATSGSVGIGIANNFTAWQLTTTALIPANQWANVVIVRSGTGTNQTSFYINGTRVLNGTLSYSFAATTNCLVGQRQQGSGLFPGYISNFRFALGTAVYNPTSATLTVPTAPLTAISGTTLLMLQSNYFKDNSSNNFAITATGTPKIQAFSPFVPAAVYSTATVGGSVYFNGTPDCLSVATNTAFDCGTGNWTIEVWVYAPAQTTTAPAIISNKVAAYGAGTIKLVYSNSTANAFAFSAYDVTSLAPIFQSSVLNTNNTWQHVAVVRNGTALTMYRNGVSVATTTISAGITFNFGNNGFGMGGGNWDAANSYYTGYISDARVLKGTALYTTAFTPPTAPLTAVTNTSILLNATNAAIFDQTAKNDLVTVGTTAVSATQSKFGGKSMFFNGTTDYLTTVDNPTLQFGTGDFTIEMWVYPTVSISAQVFCGKGAGADGFELRTRSSAGLSVYTFYLGNGASPYINSSQVIVLNTWQHLAVVRSGTTMSLYYNGISVGSTASATNSFIASGSAFTVGTSAASPTVYAGGYIDDFRITKGIARYTANFTAPTATFLNQ